MARTNMPVPEGVTIDEGRVNDFMHGVYGSNAQYNARAVRGAEDIIAALLAYKAYRTVKSLKNRGHKRSR